MKTIAFRVRQKDKDYGVFFREISLYKKTFNEIDHSSDIDYPSWYSEGLHIDVYAGTTIDGIHIIPMGAVQNACLLFHWFGRAIEKVIENYDVIAIELDKKDVFILRSGLQCAIDRR